MKRALRITTAAALLWLGLSGHNALDLGLEPWELLTIIGGISILYLERRESRDYDHKISNFETVASILATRIDSMGERVDATSNLLRTEMELGDAKTEAKLIEWTTSFVVSATSGESESSEPDSGSEDKPPRSTTYAPHATR